MDDKQVQEIIDSINSKYDEEVLRPVKFVVKRKAKKIEKIVLNNFPESFRKCTLEELILILKDAHEKNLLKFWANSGHSSRQKIEICNSQNPSLNAECKLDKKL